MRPVRSGSYKVTARPVWRGIASLLRVADTSTQGHEVDPKQGQTTRDNNNRESPTFERIPTRGSSQSRVDPTQPIDWITPNA